MYHAQGMSVKAHFKWLSNCFDKDWYQSSQTVALLLVKASKVSARSSGYKRLQILHFASTQ